MTRARCRAALAASALAVSACGGGAPLLHSAHTLPASRITFAAGTSGHFAVGGLETAEDGLDDAAKLAGGARTDEERARFVRGALARFAVAPGVAPYLSGRAGLGNHNEAGVTYTARSLRIDGRHAFEWPTLALSVGIVAIGALPRLRDRPEDDLNDVDVDSGLRTVSLVSVRGYGLELPVLFGWRSDADVVKLWTGLRGGFEQDSFDLSLVESPQSTFFTTGDATRFWAGGLVGFSIGLPPIEVRVELDAAYESIHGDLETAGGELTADVAGLSLTPAMAISAKF